MPKSDVDTIIKNNPMDVVIRECLEAAILKGMPKPQLNIGDFTFTIAPPHGNNPDFIYVKHKGQYLGKVKGATLSLILDESNIETVIALGDCFNLNKDQLFAEAVSYGRKTGICSCCGRTLTNAVSKALGIGPICREKFGWSTALVDVEL